MVPGGMGWKTLCELQEWIALATFERPDVAALHVAARRERDDRCLSLRRSASFAPIDPNSERSPFSSVSGLSVLAVGTICESPRTGSHVLTTADVRAQLDFAIDLSNCCTAMFISLRD